MFNVGGFGLDIAVFPAGHALQAMAPRPGRSALLAGTRRE
jgi:hypothetical protein